MRTARTLPFLAALRVGAVRWSLSVGNRLSVADSCVLRHERAMFRSKHIEASLSGIEIGATGPNRLQFVLRSGRSEITVNLGAEEARWLAHALEHWAQSSELIPAVKAVS